MVAVLRISVPSFILAVPINTFARVQLGLVPVSGWKGFNYTILPSGARFGASWGILPKLTRSGMLEQSAEYVKQASANGRLSSSLLRNALLPVVSYLGPLLAGVVQFPSLSKASSPFSLGGQFVQCITNRDYTVISQGDHGLLFKSLWPLQFSGGYCLYVD